jgi:hypothetical protein
LSSIYNAQLSLALAGDVRGSFAAADRALIRFDDVKDGQQDHSNINNHQAPKRRHAVLLLLRGNARKALGGAGTSTSAAGGNNEDDRDRDNSHIDDYAAAIEADTTGTARALVGRGFSRTRPAEVRAAVLALRGIWGPPRWLRVAAGPRGKQPGQLPPPLPPLPEARVKRHQELRRELLEAEAREAAAAAVAETGDAQGSPSGTNAADAQLQRRRRRVIAAAPTVIPVSQRPSRITVRERRRDGSPDNGSTVAAVSAVPRLQLPASMLSFDPENIARHYRRPWKESVPTIEEARSARSTARVRLVTSATSPRTAPAPPPFRAGARSAPPPARPFEPAAARKHGDGGGGSTASTAASTAAATPPFWDRLYPDNRSTRATRVRPVSTGSPSQSSTRKAPSASRRRRRARGGGGSRSAGTAPATAAAAAAAAAKGGRRPKTAGPDDGGLATRNHRDLARSFKLPIGPAASAACDDARRARRAKSREFGALAAGAHDSNGTVEAGGDRAVRFADGPQTSSAAVSAHGSLPAMRTPRCPIAERPPTFRRREAKRATAGAPRFPPVFLLG